MQTVYKYEIPLDDSFAVYLPVGAQVLSFQAQRETPCIWALVDPEAVQTKRHFRLAGTGHPIGYGAEKLAYVGTAQFRGGSLVFHLFEVLPAPLPAKGALFDTPFGLLRVVDFNAGAIRWQSATGDECGVTSKAEWEEGTQAGRIKPC